MTARRRTSRCGRRSPSRPAPGCCRWGTGLSLIHIDSTESLGLAANTVAKAYRALETDGVIETRGRNGTFVAAAGSAAEREAAAAAQAYAERVQRLGLGEADALAAVRDALRAAYEDE